MRFGPFVPLGLAAFILGGCGERAPEGATVIRAARLYTAPDRPPIDDAVVLFAEGRILAAGLRGEVATRGAATLEQCDAGTVVAGFQNSHVHFTEPKWEQAAKRPAAELASSLDQMLTRFGFTTVLDTGSDVDNTVALRARIESGEIAGPRILTAGMPLYPQDGIPFYLRDLPADFLAKLPQPATVEESLALVQSNLDRGADATKLFVMTPQGGGRAAFMEPDIALAAADETHRRGLPVLAHPTDIEGINLAIEAGVDVLVHTTIGEGKTVWEPSLVSQLVSRTMAVVPTLQLWPYELKRAKLEPRIVELATAYAVEQVRAFEAAGGQVLFGTDVGYMSEYDPAEEYRLLARALSPMEILASLTSTPAARWKEGAQRGRIDKGLDADLVVLEADPAADAANFAKVRCTIRAGRVIHG
ncbi:MAG: amidohydrolase family protein, partial [Steroidobacteraceae bacterium]